jgi:hypothetical protein
VSVDSFTLNAGGSVAYAQPQFRSAFLLAPECEVDKDEDESTRVSFSQPLAESAALQVLARQRRVESDEAERLRRIVSVFSDRMASAFYVRLVGESMTIGAGSESPCQRPDAHLVDYWLKEFVETGLLADSLDACCYPTSEGLTLWRELRLPAMPENPSQVRRQSEGLTARTAFACLGAISFLVFAIGSVNLALWLGGLASFIDFQIAGVMALAALVLIITWFHAFARMRK